jgi:UDP-N-acetyl-D-mannosaminuronic acid dehydrogenase
VNDAMPQHVASRLSSLLQGMGRPLKGAKILMLGYTYLEDSDDTRNSPSQALVKILQEQKASVVIHDPYVPHHQGDPLNLANGCDAAVLMVRHTVYAQLALDELKAALRTPLLMDGRGMFQAEKAKAAGLFYWSVGVGQGSAYSMG